MNKVISSTEKWIEKGRRIWVAAKGSLPNPHEDAFLQAKVLDIKPKEIIINLKVNQTEGQFDNKSHSVAYQDCQKLTYGPLDVSDMVDLEELNQPQLLFNLKRRYVSDSIFTYCGPTLVILNPYSVINRLFNEQLLLQYQAYTFQQSFQSKTLPPHIFGLAAFCLWQLYQNSRNQSIVISGESGAGKTENTKYCLKYLASLGKNLAKIIKDKVLSKIISSKIIKSYTKKDSRLVGIQDKILGCNQILQAFGNAKTIRNDNSSRFGKLILLLYGDTQFDIKSAFIISYLLEKSRIVTVSDGERNYHIFYYFLKGLSEQQKKLYQVTKNIGQYYYLNQSTVTSIKGVSDQTKFEEVYRDFQNYFSKDQINCILKILSIVLNLGNLKFKKEMTKNNQQMAVTQTKDILEKISSLLDVNYQSLEHSFQYKSRKMGQNVIHSPLKYDEAIALQNSFAKNLYEKTFFFIVGKLNQKIELQKIDLNETNKSFRKSIGILDIFGFEVLGTNSLEQFFINFANQKLQQLFVSYVFKEQKNQFMKQGLQQFSLSIDFQDNQPVIDIFQSYPLGIFHLINESSQLNKPDENLPETIVKSHPKTEFLVIPRAKKGVFIINHSCSPVNYSTAGFTNRNKDQFPQQLLDVIMSGNDETLKKIIISGDGRNTENRNRSASSKKFLGSKFLSEMNKLTDQLYSSDCHFVRCIKPNNLKSPKMFNSQAVLQSLRYLGVLDSILIRKLGFIYRRPFRQFLKKFFQIDQYIYRYDNFVKGKSDQEIREHSKDFILRHAPNQYKNKFILMGNTKVVIKEAALNVLEVLAKQKRKIRIQSAAKIKRMYINAIFRQKVKKWLKSIKILKMNFRFLTDKIRESILKKKVKKVQKYVKAYLLQKRLQKIKVLAEKSLIKIIAFLRMKKHRIRFFQTKEKIQKLQSNIRMFLTAKKFAKIKNCRQIVTSLFEKSWTKIVNSNALRIQKNWKGFLTRKRYKSKLQQIRKKIRLVKYKHYLLHVMGLHKFNIFKKKLSNYITPIVKLQSYVRRKFSMRSYSLAKNSAILIQRNFRAYLRKKYFLIKKWKGYRKLINISETHKLNQIKALGIQPNLVKNVKISPQTTSQKIVVPPHQMFAKYSKKSQIQANRMINQTISFKNKNIFQLLIGDYDILSTNSYTDNWLKLYCKAKQQMFKKGQYPVYVNFNDENTAIISNKDKIYQFSSKGGDIVQKIQINGSAQVLSFTDAKGYLLRNDRKIYTWGWNGIDKVCQSKINNQKFQQSPLLGKQQIIDICCKGNKKFVIDSSGQVLTQECLSDRATLCPINFLPKAQIKYISSSYSFTLFLATNGLVYSQGSNRYGQLGIGLKSNQLIKEPQIITYFQKNKEIIQTISVGMSHCVAKSKLGYVFAWGSNCFKQFSSKNVDYVQLPQLIELEEGKMKCLQIAAGFRSTYILNEHMKTVAFGTSSAFMSQKGVFNFPLDLIKKTSNIKSLIELKIQAKWSRQLSILFVSAIDTSKCKQGSKTDVLMKYAKMISKQWPQNKTFPVYHQWIENTFMLTDMRKSKFQSGSPNEKPISKTQSSKDQLQELKALMNLRKSSTVFKKQAELKIETILRRLNNSSKDQWRQFDRQLYEYIQQKIHLFK